MRNYTIAFGFICLVASSGIVAGSFWIGDLEDPFWKQVDRIAFNLAFTLIGISGTVLIVDRLNELRAVDTLKKSLVRDAGSTNNAVSIRSLRELRALDGHLDGTMIGCDLSGADLSKAPLSGASMERAVLVSVNLTEGDLSGAGMHQAALNGSNLSKANLEHADLSSAEAIDCNFQNADLSGANLQSGNFNSANFVKADLSNVDLRGANLVGAKFDDARMDNAKLAGSKHSESGAVSIGRERFEDAGDGVYLCKADLG